MIEQDKCWEFFLETSKIRRRVLGPLYFAWDMKAWQASQLQQKSRSESGDTKICLYLKPPSPETRS